MALVKGTNSYVTVDEADAYFEDRLDVSAWEDADETQKSQALTTATSILDNKAWTGTVVDTDQSLAWPRIGVYFDPRLGLQTELTSTVPQRILTATYELAYHLLNNSGIQDSTGSVVDIEVGPIKLKTVSGASLMPSTVKREVNPLLNSGGSRLWWRAN